MTKLRMNLQLRTLAGICTHFHNLLILLDLYAPQLSIKNKDKYSISKLAVIHGIVP